MKKTAIAPANIAFIKYWGKKDEKLRLPANSSISMNLDNCFTTTTVEFDKKYTKDSFQIINDKVNDKEIERVSKHLDRLRKIAKVKLYAKVISQNSFPEKTGIAASASGFAALTLAASSSLGLELSEKELSILARLGSGSACRSIPEGFVEWKTGATSEESYAYSLYPGDDWDLRDILIIVSSEKKKVTTTEGHKLGETSIFYKPRIQAVNTLVKDMKEAFAKKDFQKLGVIIEKDCLYMHSVMMTSNPPLFYWYPKTIEIIKKVYEWREERIPVYFTIDAGPNVHLICQGKNENIVLNKLKEINDIKDIIVNKPAKGAHLINNHLF